MLYEKKSKSEIKSNKIFIQETEIINELRKENYRLKNILKKIPGSVYYKDDKGVYLYCNDR
jgi:PAS domain-containing protein